MKAAVLYSPPLDLIVENDLELPGLETGQVLVQMAYSGVCHSQLMEVRGKRGADPYLPHLLGHEGSGRVEAVGPGVSKLKAGDRVILGWIKGQGQNAMGPKIRHKGRVINAGSVTTFSEYSIVSENRCTLLPAGVPMDVAVLFGCAVLTGAGIVTHTLKPAPGSTVAVVGLGGIGMSALMATRLFECARVVAFDVSDEKLRLAREIGATDVVNSAHVDPVSEGLRLTENRGFDYAVESAGMASTIEQAFALVRRGGGRCVFASHPEAGAKIQIDPFELICGKQIEGSWGGQSNPDVDIPRFADEYRRGRLPLEKLISKRYRLDQINEAIEDLEHKRVGRPLIEINPNLE